MGRGVRTHTFISIYCAFIKLHYIYLRSNQRCWSDVKQLWMKNLRKLPQGPLYTLNSNCLIGWPPFYKAPNGYHWTHTIRVTKKSTQFYNRYLRCCLIFCGSISLIIRSEIVPSPKSFSYSPASQTAGKWIVGTHKYPTKNPIKNPNATQIPTRKTAFRI